MPAGFQAEQLDVQQVRRPGQRMPVDRVGGSQCPSQSLRGQPATDVRIVDDVGVVVIADEVITPHGVVNSQRERKQRQRRQQAVAERAAEDAPVGEEAPVAETATGSSFKMN